MRLSPALLLLPLLLSPCVSAQAQGAPATASSILSPALTQLRQSLSGLRLDKWKAPGPVREETNGNIGSITRDLDGTLPPLLATADAAPASVAHSMPVFRNVDALYDVLLRVVETADLSAPENDTNTLHQALASLDDARRTLGDTIQSSAVAQESQLAEIHNQQAAAPVSTKENVVDDGVKSTHAAAHKRKPATPKPDATAPPQ